MGNTVSNRWLDADGWPYVNDDNAKGYGLPDYPGKKTGPGRYAVVTDPTYSQPEGFLWTNDKDGADFIDFEADEDVFPELKTGVVLDLRAHHWQGTLAGDAFDIVAKKYHAKVKNTDDLAKITIADLKLDQFKPYLG